MGATTANGSIVTSRYSRTFSRDELDGVEKNSDPASDAAMQASPHMLTACADTSRENGDGARKRGSVVAILGAEGTPAWCTKPLPPTLLPPLLDAAPNRSDAALAPSVA